MNKEFIANLSSTYADVRKLNAKVVDAKKIKLNGKNVLEHILDERGEFVNNELDMWSSHISTDENGNVIIEKYSEPKYHTSQDFSEEQIHALNIAAKIVNNEVLDSNGERLMFWQTNGLTRVENQFMYYRELSSSFEFNSDLSNLTEGYYMFQGHKNLTSFKGNLEKLRSGSMMFRYTALSSFTQNLGTLDYGSDMFADCQNLKTFESDLSNITQADGMFDNCKSLSTFHCKSLDNLKDGSKMFMNCENLTNFYESLGSLTRGGRMFYYTGLSSFDIDMPKLQNGYEMFKGCNYLTSISSDMSSLKYGGYMFLSCYELTSFDSCISSLENGCQMFDMCSLDSQSVSNIIHHLPQRATSPDISSGQGFIYIGIGIANDEESKQTFAEQCLCSSWEELNQEFSDKNWLVQWQFNGATTYDLRGGVKQSQILAKLSQVFMPTEEQIQEAKEKGQKVEYPRYSYTSPDSSKFFNIHWYHSSNGDNAGYTEFNSLEEAIETFGVICK